MQAVPALGQGCRECFEGVVVDPAVAPGDLLDAPDLLARDGLAARAPDLRSGLADTIAWYRENQDWWRNAKVVAEARYARLGR